MMAQIIVSSLSMGSIYALTALAMVMIYKASEVPNFAQGEMAMIAAYIFYALFSNARQPFAVALIGALVAALLLGFLFEFLVLRRAGKPHALDVILMTLGFQLVLHGFAGWTWGGEQRDVPFPLSDGPPLTAAGVTFSRLDLATFVTALICMLGLYGFFRTRWGTALRAMQQQPEAARFNGIRIHRMRALTWMLSSLVGAGAALLLAPVTTLDPALMWDPVLKGFAAAVLGGMRSLPGAALGGFLLAVVENLLGTYVGQDVKSAAAFAVIVAVLCVRPEGLLGRPSVRKV